MFKNYFKMTIRNIAKYKMNSFITISGLAVGMACFILILSYTQYEESYDNFHLNQKDIYRLDVEKFSNGHKYHRVFSSAQIAPLLMEEFPSVKEAVRFHRPFFSLVNVGEDVTDTKQFLFADASVFSVFTFPLKVGNSKTALVEPFSIVLTPEIAKRYFGDSNPIGEIIEFQTKGKEGKFSFKVTGITEKTPSNSTIKFDFLASFTSILPIYGEGFLKKWDSPNYTYLQLEDNFYPEQLEQMFPTFIRKHIGSADESVRNFRLLPLLDTYGEKIDGARIGDGGFKPLSYMFLLIAFFVLIIASLNFMNLLSARSSTRAKEIGIRKVQGANRFNIFNQFISESVIISLISLIFAIILVQLLLPSFHSFISDAYPTLNVFAARKVEFGILNFRFISYMFLTSIVVGVLSGVYPALILSKYEAAFVIKGEKRDGNSSQWFRRFFTVTQFTIAVVFIICSLHIMKQIDHMKNLGHGFESENILTIPIYENSVKNKYNLLKNELLKIADVKNVTTADLIPGGFERHILFLKSEEIEDKRISIIYVDHDFIEAMGLNINGGRNFSDKNENDTKNAFLINSGAMKDIGWENVMAQQIELYNKNNEKKNIFYTGQLIGTFEDFTFANFKAASSPLILKIKPSKMNYVFIKLNSTQNAKTINAIKKVWKQLNFDQSFEYTYLEDEINEFHKVFNAVVSLIQAASILAIIISILGLFALATFMIERQTKEISIRKVLGASIKNIVYKLSKSFVLLVIIANVIAWPIAYKVVSLIFQGMSDNVGVNLWLFFFTAIFSIVLAAFTTGAKSFSAAKTNPIENLRNE